ncbi:MAG TPA: hypothetical protein VMT34_18190 [Aggregatilineales bacterium]|nr:hypothetical protein [Aggregatilineales bacterium]
MIDELEALIGYVFVVGGRAVGATPSGALVELPPKKSARGREGDTFFTLITPAGANQRQADFYEALAHRAADLYFHSGGGVTSGLREAISGLNTHLLDQIQEAAERVEVNAIAMVLRGQEIFVARAGACIGLLRQGDSYTTFPADLQDEYAINALPLGYSPVPDIKLTRFDIAPTHVLVLADAAFAGIAPDLIQAALGGSDVQAIIEPLKSAASATRNAQAMVVQFVTTDTPDPVLQTPQAGAKVMRSSSASSAAPAKTAPAKAVPARPAAPKPGPVRPASDTLIEAANPDVPTVVPEATIAPEFPVEWANAVDAVSPARPKRSGVINAILDRLLPEPDENGPHIPAMMAAGLAILVPLVVVVIVVALQLSQFDRSAFDQSVEDIQKAADQAAALSLGDSDKAKAAWVGVLERIVNLETTSGRLDDPTLEDIKVKAQARIDTFDKVTRRPTTTLRTFPAGSRLARPVVRGGGTDMYTLDMSTSAIYRDTLNPTTNTRLTLSASPIVQRGSSVGDNNIIGQLVDLQWMTEGGVPRGGNLLTALDTAGLLVTYSPTFAPAQSQRLAGSAQWVKPIAMAAWQGRLYILDAGANQIWRYLPNGNQYPDSPQEYFAVDRPPSLKNAVDFGIDTSGNVYILFSDGTLKKYNGGDSRDFTFKGLPDGSLKSASGMYVDTDSILSLIYIADPFDQSIYAVTMEGRFLHRYRSTDLDAFKHITGVYADKGRVYVASGEAVYVFTTDDSTALPSPTP